jgi:hypothetical protein
MKTAGVVFNGIQFPFTLMDQAILWARNNRASLHAIFLISDETGLSGLNLADNARAMDEQLKKEESQKNTETYLTHQRKLVEDTAAVEKIPCLTEIRQNPAISDILSISEKWDILFLDADADPAHSLHAVRNFTMEELMERSACNVAWVHKDK